MASAMACIAAVPVSAPSTSRVNIHAISSETTLTPMMNQTHSFGVTDILPPLSIPSGDPAGETLIDRQSEVYSRVNGLGQGDRNFFVHCRLDPPSNLLETSFRWSA